MSNPINYTRPEACRIVAQGHPTFDRSTEGDQSRLGGYRPEPFAGQLLYDARDLIALDYQQSLIAEGHKVKTAGALASRLRCAMRDYPEASLLALVTMENGNRVSLPFENVDLFEGYNSGAMTRETLVIDVRNLRVRADRLIAEAAKIVGEADA
ncbi:hypothetical protein [Qipengyuania nanhaisediminis]|uniref:hypothetical protein n=1 Tax=Qipengyuania nanhaisediminis TaxID=604088 RepID=UPI0038B272BB